MSDWPSNWRSDTAHGPRIDGMGRSELEQEVYATRRRAALDVHVAASPEAIADTIAQGGWRCDDVLDLLDSISRETEGEDHDE